MAVFYELEEALNNIPKAEKLSYNLTSGEISVDLKKLSSLKRLNINVRGFVLKEIPEWFADLPLLEELSIEGNCQFIHTIPKNLTHLIIYSNDVLETLPNDLFQDVRQLKYLKIRWCAQLQNFPSELQTLSSLREVEAQKTAISTLPNSVKNLTGLFKFDFTDSQLTEFPLALCELSQLVILRLNGNQLSVLPQEITKMERLSSLWLDNNQFTELPSFLEDLPNFDTLSINENQLSQFPESFQNISFHSLYFDNNQFTEFPQFLLEQKVIGTLHFRSNQLTSVPKELVNLTRLESISLEGNPLKERPFFLLEMPNLKKCDAFEMIFSSRKSLLKAFQDYTQTEKDIYYGIIEGNLENIPLISLFKALSIKFPPIQEIALNYLLKAEKRELKKNPIQKSSGITILGNTQTKKTEFKQRITKLGLTYATKITAKTTHVILAKGAKNYDNCDKEGLVFISEQSFHNFLKKADTLYLEEDTASEHDIENLRALLTAKDPDSVALGVEMLKSMGVPQDLITELCLVVKNGFIPSKTRTKARKILMLNCSDNLKEQFSIYKKLFISPSINTDARFFGYHITSFGYETELDLSKVGLYIAKQVGKYDPIFLKYIKDSDLHFEFLEQCFETGEKFTVSTETFSDLSYLFKVKRQMNLWVNSMEDYEFLKEKFHKLKLMSLNLYNLPITELPPNLDKIKTLYTLQIPKTKIAEFPKELEAMRHIRNVYVADNAFTDDESSFNQEIYNIYNLPSFIFRK